MLLAISTSVIGKTTSAMSARRSISTQMIRMPRLRASATSAALFSTILLSSIICCVFGSELTRLWLIMSLKTTAVVA